MIDNHYKEQVALVLHILPLVFRETELAIHGGTAINLFYQNMPRYSVDIDLTYTPIKSRIESIEDINKSLMRLKSKIEKALPGIHVVHKPEVLKLLCMRGSTAVKIEVNGIKRGILGETVIKELCSNAQEHFQTYCKARTVPFAQLYGGKIAAALSRQHPRDMFDCRVLSIMDFGKVKEGLVLNLLGSDKPLIESLCPNRIYQGTALEKQFDGMSDGLFSYEEYEGVREFVIESVNSQFTQQDKEFFLSFEAGEPNWDLCCAGDLSQFPSVQWKLLNIERLKTKNQKKYLEGITKLTSYFSQGKDVSLNLRQKSNSSIKRRVR